MYIDYKNKYFNPKRSCSSVFFICEVVSNSWEAFAAPTLEVRYHKLVQCLLHLRRYIVGIEQISGLPRICRCIEQLKKAVSVRIGGPIVVPIVELRELSVENRASKCLRVWKPNSTPGVRYWVVIEPSIDTVVTERITAAKSAQCQVGARKQACDRKRHPSSKWQCLIEAKLQTTVRA